MIHRVFNVRVVDNTKILARGTGFVVDEDNREYLVTARHIVENLGSGDIQFMRDDGWATYPTKATEHGTGTIDISVIALLHTLVLKEARFTTPLGMDGIVYGQEVMFLGFPGGYDPNSAPKLGNGFPLPLVKYARLSSMPLRGYPMSLDGHNNPGFSGSRLCFAPNRPNEIRIAGVVTAYQYLKEPVYAKGDLETEWHVRANMGLAQAWDIQHALDLIHKNPVGAVINSSRVEATG